MKRLTKCANNGGILGTRDVAERVDRVIFPPEQDIENHTRQVISWMQAARW